MCYVTGLEPSADWITTEIEVRIRESHGDDDFVNQTGVIRNISVRFPVDFFCDSPRSERQTLKSIAAENKTKKLAQLKCKGPQQNCSRGVLQSSTYLPCP